MRRLIQKTTSVWKTEEGFSFLLAILVGTLFVAPLLKDAFPALAAAGTVLTILLFVAGVLVVSRRVWATLAVSVLTATAIAFEITQQIDASDPFRPWRVGTAGLTIGLFTAVTLARVFSPGPVTSHRLVGAIVAYLLVGLTWAYVFELLEAVRHGSFQMAQGAPQGSYPAFLYYSFVTLTTVGYGDILPISSAARALSNLESVVGVLYPAVLIGRLLSKQSAGNASGPASEN